MTELYSQYESGAMFPAGTIVGSFLGTSGINPIVDRLNSVAPSNDLISGTPLEIYFTDGTPATTTTKGLSSFNTNDFAVSTGAVSLKNKTAYWTCMGNNFKPTYPKDKDYDYGASGRFSVGVVDDVIAKAPVFLPQGAVITGIIVYGNISDETFSLYRVTLSTLSKELMAGANINSEDTTIGNATVNNATYGYYIETSTLDNTDLIYGARITYTTDYD